MSFPHTRLRRLRRTPALRNLVREQRLNPNSFVLPIFVIPGDDETEPIEALPGHARMTVDRATTLAQEAEDLGVGGVILFGIPSMKDEDGSEAWSPDGSVQRAVRAIKEATSRLVVVTDVCLCQYTSHGHCGVLRDGEVVNDETLDLLTRVALSHAQAGADIVAPSDMMDGRVGAIRTGLDEHGFTDVAIMSYSAKFASAFYGPFREAAGSTPAEGDRRGYQMDPANADEAIRESVLDVAEGADMLMVKPAMTYLDIAYRIKSTTGLPLAGYYVSGEYSMLRAAAERGWIDERQATLEALTSMQRAGIDILITYAALDAARWLREDALHASTKVGAP